MNVSCLDLHVGGAGQHQRKKRANGECQPFHQLHGHPSPLLWSGKRPNPDASHPPYDPRPPKWGITPELSGDPKWATSPAFPLQDVL